MLKVNNKSFELDGKKINIYSGAIHYFRILPEYWEDRLTKLKLAGFNTVETYVAWNMHEKSKGEFDFSGRLDIVKFLEIAQKVGLYAIVRPGPYICAEWDFGGLPAWLLKDKNLQIRCVDSLYLRHVKEYFNILLPILSQKQITKGGNIIAMQVENEYGSYGNDKEYLNFIKDLYISNGIDTLLFTSDGPNNIMLNGGALSDVLATVNFGSDAKKASTYIRSNEPYMCMEFWCGWFDAWGEAHHTRDVEEIKKEVQEFFRLDASFNFYMFCGGTNFGFMSGANYDKKYSATVTSYDYAAPLTESGDYTPLYFMLRKMLHEHQNIQPQELLPPPTYQNIGEVQLTEFAELFDNLDNISKRQKSVLPQGMEYYGQNQGLIYYERTIKGKTESASIELKDVHDIAYVFVDGCKKATYSRFENNLYYGENGNKSLVIPPIEKECKLGVLVDAMGRVNYGDHMMDRKGISSIKFAFQQLMNVDVYCLPLDNLEKLKFKSTYNAVPVFLKGTFLAKSKEDCFIHFDGFTKGCIFVNGFNLGRYWKIGPAKSLYCPGALLKDKNEIIVFEQEGFANPSVIISNDKN